MTRRYITAFLALGLLVISTSPVILGNSLEWSNIYSSQDWGSTVYTINYGKGLGTPFYQSLEEEDDIFATYFAKDENTGNNVTILRVLFTNGSVSKVFVISGADYTNIYPGDVDLSYDGGYVILVLTGRESGGDADGLIVIINNSNSSDYSTFILDSLSSDSVTITSIGFEAGFYTSNHKLFVVGNAVYNGVSYGLLVAFTFDGEDIVGEWARIFSASGIGFSESPYVTHVFFRDVTIGPDGYLYVGAYLPYSSGTQFYDYYGGVVKMDPQTGDVITSHFYDLSYQNTVASATWTAEISTDGDYIYALFNAFLSDSSRGVLIGKLDTDLDPVWTEYWNEPGYTDLGFDLEATSQGNLVVSGVTDRDYETSLSGFNTLMLSLSSSDGSCESATVIGGGGDDITRNIALNHEGFLYGLGYTTSQGNMESFEVGCSNIQVSQRVNKPVAVSSKPAPYSIGPREIIGHGEVPYNIPASQATDEHKQGDADVDSLSTSLFHLPKEGSYVKDKGLLLSTLTPPVGLPSEDPPGLLYRLSEPIGEPIPPPEPVPESAWIALIITLSAIILIGRKYWF
ncbi:MAG: hypothetical protein DRO10_03940 [Thermoprotei archaeon]|nr:MAG: hypothetical protein DRO10_03940 [Thermoprotei archaeon]